MLPTSLALAWPLWRRHGWGLIVSGSYLAANAAAALALAQSGLDRGTINAILIPLTLVLLAPATFLVAVFSLGLDVDVSGCESCFPPSLFRLPVPTRALVGWQLLYGAAAMLFLWLGTALLILQPWLILWDVTLPIWWPAGMAVATMAWVQAILWMPVGLPLFRVVLMTLLIPTLVVLAEISVEHGLSEGTLVGMYAAISATAWIVAYRGVRRARRGDTPDWEPLVRPLRQLLAWRPALRRRFRSALGAQVWFEWRRNGLALPLLIAVVLPPLLWPLVFGANDAIPMWRTLLSALALPVLMGGIAGTTVSGNNAWVKDYYGVSPFTATLPMSTAGLVAAKLGAAALSTLFAWCLTLASMATAIYLTGSMNEFTVLWRRWLGDLAPLQSAAVLVAAVLGLVIWTWKRLVDSLLMGVTGRKWIIQGNLLIGLTGLVALAALGGWLYRNPDYQPTVRTAVPWLLGGWILCRLLAAGAMLRLALRLDLIQLRTVLAWVFAEMFLALSLFAIFAWTIPKELVAPQYVFCAVLLVMPMAHLAATPVALAWNRHR